MYNNLELNVDVTDKDAAWKVDTWFEKLWSERTTLDVTAEILALLQESWASDDQRTPYEVFLKVCHSLSKDVREGNASYSLPLSMRDVLLDYQASAVKTLARRLITRGGTMLGDVVGLGKTYTAIATSLMLQASEDYTTLVLCPKNLEDMWQEHLEAYDILGKVVPYSMATKILPDLRRHMLVICDESHTLRKDTRKDYEAIRDYVSRNGSKVLLLTATPYNLDFQDVAAQLALYVGENDDLGIEPTAALREDPTLADKVDGKTSTLQAFRKSENADDWKRLMSDHLVRRTRSFIKNNYAKTEVVTLPDGTAKEIEYLTFPNGERFVFPRRLARPISHAFSENDPAAIMESDQTIDGIKSLCLPRYNAPQYIDQRKLKTKEDKDFAERAARGRGHVAGFVRTGLYKRLSSCGNSFIQSLDRQLARNELCLYAVDNDLAVPLGSLDTKLLAPDPDHDIESPVASVGSIESRYSWLQRENPANVTWVSPRIFHPSFHADLKHDNEVLTELLGSFGTWSSTHDSKIKALVELIENRHPGEKVLIFTEYKDTANYVASALTEHGVGNVGVATGDTDNPRAMARRFSPNSNKKLLEGGQEVVVVDPEDELHVLVATDVLSEGQNLQDAHIVVNYDLPWAIVRLIQRAGRVDRVGQQAPTVYIYSLFHQNLEQELKLRSRIAKRLESSAKAFGSDEQFFGSAEEVQVIGDFYNGQLTSEDDADDVDAGSQAYEIWSKAQEEHPQIAQRVLSMPDMVYSTRAQRSDEFGGSLGCYINTESGLDAFAVARSDGKQELITAQEALRHFYAEHDTPTAPQRSDHLETQQELVHGPLSRPGLVTGQMTGVRKRVWNRLGGTLFQGAADVALSALYERRLNRQAEQALGRMLRTATDQELIDLLVQLHEDNDLVIAETEKDPIRIVCSMGVSG
jgi:superfamily II DNA or RNA helicase